MRDHPTSPGFLILDTDEEAAATLHHVQTSPPSPPTQFPTNRRSDLERLKQVLRGSTKRLAESEKNISTALKQLSPHSRG